jgi:hypothetical protein
MRIASLQSAIAFCNCNPAMARVQQRPLKAEALDGRSRNISSKSLSALTWFPTLSYAFARR